jgi:16S rRNA (guanine966-N2)-methyltransferase
MAGLRVISGVARGMRLKSVPGRSTRPITDRVKENLFNIIGPDIISSSFLDLFAGTGSVGIEALSRGADFALFIDREQKAIGTIKSNLEQTKLGDKARIIKTDSIKYLELGPTQIFNYIYIAPPQYKGIWVKVLKILDNKGDWVSQDTWAIVQIHPREFEPIDLHNLVIFDQRQYGSTMLIFYRR